MACCGGGPKDVATASKRLSRQKSTNFEKASSLYRDFPFGDARSCEVFVEHAVGGFWHCASCGLPKCSHFAPARENPPPKAAVHAGPLLVRKTSKDRKASWRPRHGVFAGAKSEIPASHSQEGPPPGSFFFSG